MNTSAVFAVACLKATFSKAEEVVWKFTELTLHLLDSGIVPTNLKKGY